MAQYVFIESRDPFESRDTEFFARAAIDLKKRGSEVTLFLIQNGVLAARANAVGSHLARLKEAGVTLMADDFSLRERGIEANELIENIAVSNIDSLVDLLIEEDARALWH